MINVIFGMRTPYNPEVGAVLPIAIFWGIVWDSQPAGLIKTLKFGLLSGDWSVLKFRPINSTGCWRWADLKLQTNIMRSTEGEVGQNDPYLGTN